MAKLFVLTGLPGSGKSTIAEEMKGVILSSDTIREELYGNEAVQGNPQEVFGLLDKRVHENLKKGVDVIYDSTALTKTLRKNIVKKFSAEADEIISVFLDTPLDVCLERNKERKRKVPENVILRMEKRMSKPSKEEGFDKIITV